MASTAASAQTITDPAAFAAAIAAVRDNQHPTDKFAEPPAFPLDGKAFKLTIPAIDGSEGSGSVVYDYKEGSLILDASPRNVWPIMTGPSDALPSFKVSENTKSLASYVGQNAYGATARVTAFKNTGAAIAFVSAPKAMLSPSRTRMGAQILDDTDWWLKIELPPSEAKALANDVVGVIEGRYARLPAGTPGACMSGGATATLDHPTDYYSETCYIGANIDRIAFVRKSTGEVIKEWTSENSPRLGRVLWGKVQEGMTMRDLRAVYPSITSYGYIESEGVQVNLTKQVAASVEVRNLGVKGKALAKQLTDKYGPPIAIDCKYESLCQGEWKSGEGISAYMGILGIQYQPSDAKPPIGYSLKK
ncbi:hypothetical protein [uncultured Novosphingobium sp.]|uniref:hypothetical protein n=1 Tax=uncultured Novosphingobium sp. TaxID=292277 RepID=UPI002592C70C|nr:hypothetical protein [uncultured Novosphingobium sp.]